MSLQILYLSEVLGIKNYLCSEEAFSVRQIKGPLPCENLVIVQDEISNSQNQILKKIMKSIEASQYTLLILKKIQLLESYTQLIKEEHLAQFIFCFGNDFTSCSNLDFKTDSLKQLEGDSKEVRKRKMKLWSELKEWKINLKK